MFHTKTLREKKDLREMRRTDREVYIHLRAGTSVDMQESVKTYENIQSTKR